MRTFFRFWEILIVGILLTVLALATSITDIFVNEKTVRNELRKSGIYTKFNDELKKDIKDKLMDDFNKYPEVRGKFNDIVDNTFTIDVLEAETGDVLKQIYNNNERIEVDASVLIDRYTKNFKAYLAKENIELPREVDLAIDEVKAELAKEGKVDILEKDTELKDSMEQFYEIKDLSILARNILLVIILILVGFSVLVSTQKLKVVYKPLIFAGILLILFRVGISKLIQQINFNEIDEEIARNLVINGINTVISNIDKFVGIYIVSGIVLMMIKIVVDIKNDKKNITSDTINSDEKDSLN